MSLFFILPDLTTAFRTCEEPASSGAHIWPDDITKWPVSDSSGGLSDEGGDIWLPVTEAHRHRCPLS